ERLGGQAVTIPEVSVADGVLEYAHANNVTQIIVSKTERSRVSEWWRSSPALEIIRRAGDISVQIVPEQLTRAMKGASARVFPDLPEVRVLGTSKAYAGSMGMVLVAL